MFFFCSVTFLAGKQAEKSIDIDLPASGKI